MLCTRDGLGGGARSEKGGGVCESKCASVCPAGGVSEKWSGGDE